MGNFAKCKECKKTIRFFFWEPDYKKPDYWNYPRRPHPLDIAPHPDGNIVILTNGEEIRFVGFEVRQWLKRIHNEPLYKSHFDTCEFAHKFRK